MVTADKVAEILGGSAILKRRIRTAKDMDDLIASARMPREAVDRLAQRLSRDGGWKYRIVPRSTYNRASFLSEPHAQRAERLARVFALALDAWEDEDLALRFLSTPHPELDGDAPLERALTELGARAVEEIIDRGRYGLPA